MKKLIVIAIAIFGFSAVSFGQVGSPGAITATATAGAIVVTPLSIEKTADLNFGNVAVNSALGTAVITPLGVRSRTGGVSLPANVGSPSVATFTVAGQSGYAYTFTLPSSATTVTSGENTMTVDNWQTDAGTVITGGSVTVNVGATLNVKASQPAGTYLSATPFTVTINYN